MKNKDIRLRISCILTQVGKMSSNILVAVPHERRSAFKEYQLQEGLATVVPNKSQYSKGCKLQDALQTGLKKRQIRLAVATKFGQPKAKEQGSHTEITPEAVGFSKLDLLNVQRLLWM